MPKENTELNITLQLNKNNKEAASASFSPYLFFAMKKISIAEIKVEIKGMDFKITILNPNSLQTKEIK